MQITYMKHLKIIAALLFVSFAIACGSAADEDEATQPLPTKTTDTGLNKIAAPQPVTVPVPVTNSTAALNPAHGQPGHRCDIQVGAPLNSAPAANNAAPSQTQPIIMQPTPATAPAAAGTGAKNPAHGQPGHRCDIAVGAPLN
jgi:hypothetical protein